MTDEEDEYLEFLRTGSVGDEEFVLRGFSPLRAVHKEVEALIRFRKYARVFYENRLDSVVRSGVCGLKREEEE